MANADKPRGLLYESRRSATGSVVPMQFKAKANTTLATNDPVMFDATGTVTLATTTNALVGVMAHPVTGASGVTPDVLVVPVDADMVFRIQLESSVSQGNIGDTVALKGATGVVEGELAAGGPLKIIAIADGQEAGANAEVLVTVVKRAL